MTRTNKYPTEQIVEAARRVFLERGPGASSVEIAQAAGVSEGLLFKRFGTKQNLFLRAMGIPKPDVRSMVEDLPAANEEEVFETLVEALLEILGFFREVFPRMMMLWSQSQVRSFAEIHENSASPPVEFTGIIARYLERQARAGHVARADFTVAGRTLVGAVANFVFWELGGLDRSMPMSGDEYVRGLVKLVWSGLSGGGNR
jgi:AcrR family transcriptional regulator